MRIGSLKHFLRRPSGGPPQHPTLAATPRSRLVPRTQGAAAAPPERPTARRSAALHGLSWCWTCAAGWVRGALQGGAWGDGLGKGDVEGWGGMDFKRDFKRA